VGLREGSAGIHPVEGWRVTWVSIAVVAGWDEQELVGRYQIAVAEEQHCAAEVEGRGSLSVIAEGEEMRPGSGQVQAKPTALVVCLVEQSLENHWASEATVGSCFAIGHDLPQRPFVDQNSVQTASAAAVLRVRLDQMVCVGVAIGAGSGRSARTWVVPVIEALHFHPERRTHRGCSRVRCWIAAEVAGLASVGLAGQNSCFAPSFQTLEYHSWAVGRAIAAEWYMCSVVAAAVEQAAG